MIIEKSKTRIHDKITYTHVIKFVVQFRSAHRGITIATVISLLRIKVNSSTVRERGRGRGNARNAMVSKNKNSDHNNNTTLCIYIYRLKNSRTVTSSITIAPDAVISLLQICCGGCITTTIIVCTCAYIHTYIHICTHTIDVH